MQRRGIYLLLLVESMKKICVRTDWDTSEKTTIYQMQMFHKAVSAQFDIEKRERKRKISAVWSLKY